MTDYIKKDLRNYLDSYPEESKDFYNLNTQLDDSTESIFVRSNMRGHITSSGLLLHPTGDKVLLIHHNIYKTWIAPGGHVDDPTQSLVESAYREVCEETGFEINDQTINMSKTILLDIDTHHIAPNAKKNEQAHWHHDFMYLVYATDADLLLNPQLQEVSAAQWVSLAELHMFKDPRYIKICRKLDAVLALDNPFVMPADMPAEVSLALGKILAIREHEYSLQHKADSSVQILHKSQLQAVLYDVSTYEREVAEHTCSKIKMSTETLNSLIFDARTKFDTLYSEFCENYPLYIPILNQSLNICLKQDLHDYPTTF